MERIDALKARRGKLADDPCLRRLRNRRLIVSLYLQGFQPAHDWMLRETDLFMSGRHLQQLVACGQWRQALDYIRRFLPPAIGGVEARTLSLFLHAFWAVDNAAACSMGAPVTTAVYSHDVRILTTMCASNVKLSSILNKIHHSPKFRASLDWKLVREKASLIADDLALDSPELRRRLLLPRDLLPIGPCHRRHHLKKQALRPASSAIAKWYLNRKKSLPSLTPVIGLNSEGQNRVVDLIEACLKAGTVVELDQGHLLQSSAMAGAFITPFSQTMFGTTGPTKISETSFVTNAGAPTFTGDSVSRPAKIPWIISSTNAGAFSTPSSQTMLHTTGSTKNIETSSVTSAGAPTFTGLPNYLHWNPSVANSGDSVSQPAKIKIPWIISATNAGSFSTPSSQTMLDTTGSTKNIETSSVTSAGAPTFTGLPNYLHWNPSVTNSDPVDLRKRLTTAEEDDPGKKRQRTNKLSPSCIPHASSVSPSTRLPTLRYDLHMIPHGLHGVVVSLRYKQ
ncbi:uncharacterized protein LOC119356392 isoform X2 [Triticum dicoccoides]|uniref:uncharacterized protein LOC119356392 isoform X2 n=1 Tax=Triticum dicoccoides TaxID=85692 RepID=UPI00188E2155|nr:uncharacterized protein LOC119356392 isoform X2 [Triticum dicoccoides]